MSALYSQVDVIAPFDIEEDGTNASETVQKIAMAKVANDMTNDRDAAVIIWGIFSTEHKINEARSLYHLRNKALTTIFVKVSAISKGG